MPPPDPAEKRLLLAAFLIGTTVLLIAGSVTPDERGYGTHTQLGIAPCGYLLRTGDPCPTCGMTTSFAHLARFRFASAFRTQPFGALLATGLWIATVGSLFALVAGRSARPWLARLPRPRWWIAAAVLLFFASWAWTKARHDADERIEVPAREARRQESSVSRIRE